MTATLPRELEDLHAQLASQVLWVPMHAVPWLKALAGADLPPEVHAEVRRVQEALAD